MFGDSEYYYDPFEPELMPRSSQEGNEKVITASTIICSKLALTPQQRDLGVTADNAFMCHLSAQAKYVNKILELTRKWTENRVSV